MLLIGLAVAAAFLGGLVGSLTGQLLLYRISRSAPAQHPPSRPTVDPRTDEEIDRLAADWAATHGQPGAGPLLAEKLRLAFTLHRPRRPFDHEGRW